MIKFVTCILCIAISMPCSTYAVTKETDFVSRQYDILSDGTDIGDTTLILSRTKKGYAFVEHSHIKTSGWWGKINVISNLIEQYDNNISLISADSKSIDGNTVYWSRIKTNGINMNASFAEIKSISAQEKNKLAELTNMVTSQSIPEIEGILSHSQAVFADGENLAFLSAQFSKDAFDTTMNTLPFFIWKNADQPLPKKLKLLDPESLEITEMNINDLGHEDVSIGARTVPTRHLELSGSRFKPSHIWISGGSSSLPYMVRSTGEDEDGDYEIKLK